MSQAGTGSQAGATKTESRKGSASVSSRLSSLSRRGMNIFRSGGSRSSRGSVRPEEEVWRPGDQCETVSLVTMRTEEALESDVVMELTVGTSCDIIEIGEGRRVKICASGKEGWISSRTKMNEALIVKRMANVQFAIDDFEVGGQHEVKSMVTMREAESLDSEVLCELTPGTLVKILELGLTNRRRAKVASDSAEGWISMATKQGELLIGKVTQTQSEGVSLFGASSSKVKQILAAAASGDLETIVTIVEKKQGIVSRFQARPNLNCSDIRGKTPLIYASAFGNKDVVAYLVSKPEVDINAMDDTQKSAVHHASKTDKRRREGIEDGHQSEIVHMLIEAKGFIEARDHNGCTAIMFAVANGNEPVTQTLLMAGANVNVKDFDGHTPLDYAISFGHTKLAQVLRSAGAIGDDSDDEGGQDAEDDDDEPTSPHHKSSASTASTAAPGVGASQATTTNDSAAVSAEAAAKRKSTPVKKKATKKEDGEASVSVAASASVPAPKDGAGASASVAGDASAKDEKEPKPKKKATSKEAKDDKAEKTTKKGKDEKEKTSAKGKGGAKKGKVANQAATKMSPGMQEMLESQHISEEMAKGTNDPAANMVVVEEPQVEVIDQAALDRELAKQKLVALMDGSSSKELKAGLDNAKAKGVEGPEIAAAEKKLAEMNARSVAHEALVAAMTELDVGKLKKAIDAAEKAHVNKDEIAKAKAVLKEEEPKAAAREKLKSAEEKTDFEAMKKAIAEAKKAKVPQDEIQYYEDLLAGAENKDKAIEDLKAAIKSKDIAALRFAIKAGKDMKIDTSEAEKVLAVELPKTEARQELEKAVAELNVEAIKAAIAKGKKVGLAASELAEGEEVLANEEKKGVALAKVKQLMEASMKVDTTSIDAMKQAKDTLSQAINECKACGVLEASLAEAELRRRKIHNGIEDLKGSIRVFCRIRPLSKKELGQGDTSICKLVDAMTVDVKDHKFAFDAVFMPGTQAEVFEDCRDLVQSAVDGYNVTMFAYGQTGAGKTFTMYGIKEPGQEGTAPRTIHEVYKVTDSGKDRYTYTVLGSMLELYNNRLVDLLDQDIKGGKDKSLAIRTEKSGMVIIEGLTERQCDSAKELDELLIEGEKARTVKATDMNAVSSRSHLVLIIRIVSVNKETKATIYGKILICDLAGSERLGKSGVTGEMQKEAIEINKSLTALGDVIEALTKGSKQIPYRNHKLTMLMQDSLGGTAKTLMFVNCSPANSNEDETFMSLKYATRAKQIKNTSGAPKKAKAPSQE